MSAAPARRSPGSTPEPSPDPAPAPDPTPEELARARRVTVRRAPRFRVFLALGFLVGAVVAVVLATSVEPTGRYSQGAVLGYLLAGLGGVGVLAGGLVAVVLDRTRRQR